MNFVVTGAGGFLGRILCSRLLAAWPEPAHRFTLIDPAAVTTTIDDPRATWLAGDFGRVEGAEAALARSDVVIHLAAIAGGAAERDYALGKRVNLDLTLELIERVCASPHPRRFVYASTVAVFGEPLPEAIDDATPPRPTMTYGAHKRMIEIALENLTRLRRIDALALRFPGLLARPAGDASMRSAFMSELFHACANGRRFVVPTGREATVWVMSASAAADNLIHAARVAPPRAGLPRAFTLPALRVTMGDLAAAVVRRTGCAPALVSFEPDAALEAQFGRLPPLATPLAETLGFARDADLDQLVARALADAGYTREGHR
ncbi:MAG TPA: NAD-dependent epimerase/dehydratase family protein [Steroidobacteraceae bacterium]|nr:NAD-dependent epimerase/dehydratase family protein [Steroidobacteraceae bacterium]